MKSCRTIDRATIYARKVVTGKAVAGRLHVLACERHLNDLKRQETADFPYVWKPELSEDILNFAETLTIAEGEKPCPVKLYDSQCFDLGVPMGWVKTSNGKRRFRRSYESMARQNGKTFKNGIRAAYISAFGGYQYGKLFTAATKKRQARIAWEELQKFILIDRELTEHFKIQEYKSLITALGTKCTIEALSKESGLDDGFRSIFNSIDEIHQHKDDSVYKALYEGTRMLPETLNSMITTRGSNLNSFCYEMDKHCQDILFGAIVEDDFFVDIYTLDKDDDYFNESVWIKANPVLCRNGEQLQVMRSDANTAKSMGGSALSGFITKCLNVWFRNRDVQFVDEAAFMDCGCDMSLENFRGCKVIAGIDLSSGGDLTTMSLEFEIPDVDGGYFFHSHSFMPRGRFEEHIKTDLAPYDVWENEKLLTVTGGAGDFKNDYKFIIKQLREIITEYNITLTGIAVDPHNFDGFAADLEEFGVPVVTITQSARNLNDATCDMQLTVKSKKLFYNRHNKLLVWSFINAVTVANSFGEIKVDKEGNRRTRRIDPVDACICAHVLTLSSKRHTEVDYDAHMEKYLEIMRRK